MPYTELIPGIRRALEDIYVPGQRLEKEWGAPAALQMARLLGSLGPLGGDVPVQKASHKLDKRQAQVKELLDELAEQGITEPELCAVPPGHTLLEGLLRRYKALVEVSPSLAFVARCSVVRRSEADVGCACVCIL